MAFAVPSFGSTCCSDTRRKGCADECLPRLRRTSPEAIPRVCRRSASRYSGWNRGCRSPRKNRARQRERISGGGHSLFFGCDCYTYGDCPGLGSENAICWLQFLPFYSPDGRMEANYDKHHLLPGVEPEKPGDKRALLDQPSGRWGLQICKDMDFPELSREYAVQGANLLLVPAYSQRQSRSHHCGNGDGARPLRIDHWESERHARANVLHQNRRLVRLALCRHLRHVARVATGRAIKTQLIARAACGFLRVSRVRRCEAIRCGFSGDLRNRERRLGESRRWLRESGRFVRQHCAAKVA
ncbi:MAG: hypothetical protein DME98_10535 [Verrucomicrobia bacterium]|nr:MAG: hypothetical protein DME98_10535 [Verrucomicrobiota bacterium]